MYQDAGYGTNWIPEENHARRLDPHSRIFFIWAGLVAIGFVFIIIIVLSLIPVYMSHQSSTTTINTKNQVPKVFIGNYDLLSRSPQVNVNTQTLLSKVKNRRALEAALTSMIQQDLATNGSIVEINSSTVKWNYRRRRRQTFNMFTITVDLAVTSNRPCSLQACSNDFRSRIVKLLTSANGKTLVARYESLDATEISWLSYRLPVTIQSNASFVDFDPKYVSSMLHTLLIFDSTENQPSVQSSTPNIFS